MRLVWSQRALEDRRAIFDYIETDDPRAAVMVDERIEAATWRLVAYPQSGRIGRVEGTRELVIARTPYITPYRVIGDVVRILRVIHGARIWPDTFDE
ncbi:type II toxin-antitoxin system RelE/ParE family toxin [Sphingomonas sp. DT-204]|uniref:type II toxin-antitoxin system RelE/ParE family toxin n=1 Tax=Sphingomonas sp. DT-204 TaxID=3396166 RepID=UPI003F1C55BC